VGFLAPLVVTEGSRRRVQVIFDTTEGLETAFRLASRSEDSRTWTIHCTGTLTRQPAPAPESSGDLLKPPKGSTPLMKADFYATFINAGYEIGPGFQRIEEIHAGNDEALCRVQVRRGQKKERGHVAYPGSIDSILQTGLPGFFHTYMKELLADKATLVPMHIEKVVLWRDFPDEVVCRSWTSRVGEGLVSTRILAMTSTGDPVMEMAGLMMQKTNRETLYRSLFSDTAELLYATELTASVDVADDNAGPVVVLRLGDGKLSDAIHGKRGGMLIGIDEFRSNPEPLLSALKKGSGAVVVAVEEPRHANAGKDMAADTYETALSYSVAMNDLVKVLIEREAKAKIYCVIAGADGNGVRTAGIPGASLHGIFMTLMAEQPSLAGGVLDTDLSAESIDRTCRIIGGAGVPFGAVREGVYSARRLVHAISRGECPPIRSDATYLITGGSGALGLHTARWLAGKGAGCIVLASRGGVAKEREQEVSDIRAQGCRVEDVKCDVSSMNDASRLMESIAGQMPPLKGVFHAAGVLGCDASGTVP
jgi:hypothetical protein